MSSTAELFRTIQNIQAVSEELKRKVSESFAASFRDFIVLDGHEDLFFPHAGSDLKIPAWAQEQMPKLRLVDVIFRRVVQKSKDPDEIESQAWTELVVGKRYVAMSGIDPDDRPELVWLFSQHFNPAYPSFDHAKWQLRGLTEHSVTFACDSVHRKAGCLVDRTSWLTFLKWVKENHRPLDGSPHIPVIEGAYFLRIFALLLPQPTTESQQAVIDPTRDPAFKETEPPKPDNRFSRYHGDLTSPPDKLSPGCSPPERERQNYTELEQD